jgi:ribosomal protein L44E
MKKSDEPISSFRDYCPECDKKTLLYVVNEKPGHEPTGLLDTQELECSECGTRWWV